MNVLPPLRPRPATLRPSRGRRLADLLLGKFATLLLAAIALLLGIGTFVALSGGMHVASRRNLVFGLVLANLVVLLVLGAVLAGRLTRVWMERRRGSAGSRLHVRLVLLFSVVAVTPTIVVAIFATVFFDLGVQTWFNDRVRTALSQSLEASQGYVEEHRNNIRADALGMANDLGNAGRLLAGDPGAFGQVLDTQTALRGLDAAIIFEPVSRQVIASAGLMAPLGLGAIPDGAIDQAQSGDAAVLGNDSDTEVRALAQIDSVPTLMLMIERPVDPRILDHMKRNEEAVAEYQRLDENRSSLQVTLILIFGLVALLVLFAAVLIGLVIANQIARPVGRLIQAAERVRAGDYTVRVPEARSEDEVAGLSRAFNRMTGQLSSQRAELMDAYSQIDERRRFTETVLAGVSAGVVGLDAAGRVELPNRAASELVGADLLAMTGQTLAGIIPEFAALLGQALAEPTRARTGEVQVGPQNRRRTLLVRIGPELSGKRADGFVVTFDDITELQSAQRKAAWADVARRIAHEIKNPLTPIQLSAERLKRKFLKEIKSDPEIFSQCADTIVRHVGDIGRMVDEFSAFARMPQPVIRPEDIGRIVREAMVLQRTAHPEIGWATHLPDHGPTGPCDRRLLGQALTNLLQNAADSVAMRRLAEPADEAGTPARLSGHIEVALVQTATELRISVSDDGLGLPAEDRARLTEPYVTHKPKGTGLGLAIVKKIMEDHAGVVTLDDRPRGPGAVATLILPTRMADGA